MFDKASQFLGNVRTELQKVTWPARKEIHASTVVVIALVLIVSVYLWVVDTALSALIRILLR